MEWRPMVHTDMIEFHEAIFVWHLHSFGPPSRGLAAYHLKRGEMPLHDAIGVKKRAELVILWRRCQVYGLRGVCWIIVRAFSALT